jgi:hypothetical protein
VQMLLCWTKRIPPAVSPGKGEKSNHQTGGELNLQLDGVGCSPVACFESGRIRCLEREIRRLCYKVPSRRHTL